MSLRDAAQQALEALEDMDSDDPKLNQEWLGKKAITALKAALAEPVQDPVAWMDIAEDGTRLSVRMWSDGNREEVPLYTAPWAHVSRVQSDEETHGLHSAECRHKCDNDAKSK